MMQSYDLTIVGGGIVGLTLAASLADSALSIALIETNDKPILAEKPFS
ncbi:MAG: 2-octaprenylphenol hydroxylase, partial [Psychromonas sp.]